jgi:multidrug resistance efflux pump
VSDLIKVGDEIICAETLRERYQEALRQIETLRELRRMDEEVLAQRDEAREALAKREAVEFVADLDLSEQVTHARRERDEWQRKAHEYAGTVCLTETIIHERDVWADQCGQMERERDEARADVERLRASVYALEDRVLQLKRGGE